MDQLGEDSTVGLRGKLSDTGLIVVAHTRRDRFVSKFSTIPLVKSLEHQLERQRMNTSEMTVEHLLMVFQCKCVC